jgi:hypothetical protein
MEEISAYADKRGAIYVTMDEALAYLKDLKTSRFLGGKVLSEGRLQLDFEGLTENDTRIAVFADDSLDPAWREIHAFQDAFTTVMRG